jgi:formate hydrogenlyase subunit 6/NADH:ubiquinone oxidoreductase subunit I
MPAEDGMEVETDTEELRELRRDLLGMTLPEKLGVERERFAGRTSGAARPDPNPFIARNYDLCISCFRCTRICGEVEVDHAIAPAGRGFDTRIATPFDRDLGESPCTFCGQCVQTCPTGALTDKKWFAGAVATAALIFLSEQYTMGGGAVGANALRIAEAKCRLGFGPAVALGALCNALVCLAVWLCLGSRGTGDKILAILFRSPRSWYAASSIPSPTCTSSRWAS